MTRTSPSAGAVALSRAGSLRDTARALGVAERLVSSWRSGAKVPSPDNRNAIERVFGIESSAWTRIPDPDPPPAQTPGDPGPEPEPGSLADALAYRERVSAWARAVEGTATVSERVKIADVERRAIEAVSKAQAALEIDETRIVESPRFRQIWTAVASALAAHPGALAAAVAALRDVEGAP